MADYGIKVSNTGVDVKTALPTELVYSSKYTNFKIHSVVTKTVVTASGAHTTTDSVDNPIGYAPFYLPFVQDSNQTGKWYDASGYNGIVDDTGAGVLFVVAYNPTSNQFDISVKTLANWDGGTFTFKIVVFIDKVFGESTEIETIEDYGMKISKDGSEVATANDAELSMSTKYHNLTVKAEGDAATTHAGGDTISVIHELDYVPIVMIWQETPADTSRYMRITGLYQATPADVDLAYFYITNTRVYIFDGSYTPGNPDINYHYIIFNEQLTTV